MRIRISHATTYHYDTPPTGVTQILRLTPRNHDGQYVVAWRIDLTQDCQLHQHEDAFGNITHSFTAEGPFSELSVTVDGEVPCAVSTGTGGFVLTRSGNSFGARAAQDHRTAREISTAMKIRFSI